MFQAISNFSVSDRTRSMLIAFVLLCAWMYLVVAQVPNAADLIAGIKYGLIATGVLHASGDSSAPSKPTAPPVASTPLPSLVSNQAGFARPWALMILAFAAVLVIGCAQLGLTAPQTFEQKLAYQYGNVAAIRTSAAVSLTNHTIKVADAEHVQAVADQARQWLDLAKIEENVNPSDASNRLLLATSLLTQLQTFLNAQGASK